MIDNTRVHRTIPACRHPDTLAVVGGLKCKECGKTGTLAEFRADREYCDCCGEPLKCGRIGRCDECQEPKEDEKLECVECGLPTQTDDYGLCNRCHDAQEED